MKSLWRKVLSWQNLLEVLNTAERMAVHHELLQTLNPRFFQRKVMKNNKERERKHESLDHMCFTINFCFVSTNISYNICRFFYGIDCTLSLSQCVCVCARGVCFDCVCFVVGCALQFGEIAHKRVHYSIITITITEAVTWIHSGVLCDCSYSSRSQCQYPATSQ